MSPRVLVLDAPRLRAVVAVGTLSALLTVGLLVYRNLTGLPDDAVLRYSDHLVTEKELAERVDALGALYGVVEPETESERAAFNRDVAKVMAVSLVLDRAAADRDIVISEKSARDTLRKIVADQLGPDPQRAFTDLLAEFGVSEREILAEVVRQQQIARLFRQITQDAVDSVTPDEVKARYDADPTVFAVPEQRSLANIVVASKKDAVAVLRELRSGAPFAALARARSLDDATRAGGGALGTVLADALDPKYAKAAFDTKAGALFGPVETEHGWNVGKVIRVIPARKRAFKEVREEVTDTIRSERAMAAWRKWLGDQIKDAEVEYADRYRPADPDEVPADVALRSQVLR